VHFASQRCAKIHNTLEIVNVLYILNAVIPTTETTHGLYQESVCKEDFEEEDFEEEDETEGRQEVGDEEEGREEAHQEDGKEENRSQDNKAQDGSEKALNNHGVVRAEIRLLQSVVPASQRALSFSEIVF
jgi:hypothetical protein